MKKMILSLFICALGLSAFSQVTVEERTAKATEEFKAQLQSKMGLTPAAADAVIVTETEFYTGMTALRAETDLKLKEKNAQEHTLHVTRREKLMATPLTPRQMEDAIELGMGIRAKYKL